MHLRAFFLAATLGSVPLSAALGQEASVSIQPKAPSGLNFAFDAPHGQLSASGYSLNLASKSTSPITITGTLQIGITIHIVSAKINTADIPCSAVAIGGQIDTGTLSVTGGIETASSTATPSPANVEQPEPIVLCNLTIPYEWTLGGGNAGEKGLILAYAAAALNQKGNVIRSTIQINGLEPLPANGSTKQYAFSVTL
jgi:hypothetical protein